MKYSKPFIKMRDELIEACKAAYSVWENLQGAEFAMQQGWLKGAEEKQYFKDKKLWDKGMGVSRRLIPKIKEKFPNEVEDFAIEQYDRLTALIKSTPKDSPAFDDEWRSVRRNWSAIKKGKKTPFNEFWAWGTVPK